MIRQETIKLSPLKRGYHLITHELVELLKPLPETGILNLFIRHTSAALTINENADPTVREDFESIINMMVPENLPFLKHDIEGPDDMPAHIKSSLMGASINIPITEGSLALGTWQGIYLCEFRDHPRARTILASIYS